MLMLQLMTYLRVVPAKTWLYVGVLLIGGFTSWKAYDFAYDRGFAASELVWLERVEAETARQVAANDRALADALAIIETMREAKDVRDATIERLNQEAAAANDADAVGLSADSVRRLNQTD